MEKAKPKNQRKATGPWNYFPDCHVCQGMKQGRGQTSADLTKLFAEANAKQSAQLRPGKN
jgi:hypothetical protein